ncbi:hypothetical protein G6F65_018809 [Rhizopus arrhizus]|nr:hypothetical protein G6F65_018809 [Rhizopus arrhizus]
MDDDRAFARTVVEARLQPDQAQRVAVAAHVGLLRGERAEAGHETAVAIGEMLGAVVAAVASVRHPFLEQQALVGQVEHPQPRLGGRPRVVDHAEAITIDAQLGPLQRTAHGVRRQLQHVAVGLGRTARQQGSQIIGTGGKGGRLCQRRGAGGGRQQAERGQPAQAGCSHVHNGEAQLPFRVDPGGSDSKTGCIPDSAGLGRTAGSEGTSRVEPGTSTWYSWRAKSAGSAIGSEGVASRAGVAWARSWPSSG